MLSTVFGRMAQVNDPVGDIWSIATHKEDLPQEEQEKRNQTVFQAAVIDLSHRSGGA